MQHTNTARGGSLVIGLDLDGVCADYIAALRPVVADLLNVDTATLGTPRLWGFEDWGLTRDSFRAAHSEAVNARRVFRTLDTIPGAVEAVRGLHTAGDTIRVVTNRLGDLADPRVVVADTAEWLSTVGLPYHELCFVADKSSVAADVYIDDSPGVLDRLAAAGRPAIVFDHLYNRHSPGIRTRDWVETLRTVDTFRATTRAA